MQANTEQIFKFESERVWFTADTHFGHENIIRYCHRPFANAEEMNAELIRRWNETVPEDGIIFHLGDFCHGNAQVWNSILSVLHGRKYLILGNHDMKSLRQGYMGRFEHVAQQMTIRVAGQPIVLNHNPFLCYGGSYRDVWQLFGHVHSGPLSHTGLDHPRLNMLFPLQYDVGVDNNCFRPVSFAEVKARIGAQVAAARSAAGIQDDGPAPEVRRIVFVDAGSGMADEARTRLLAVPAVIIELEPSDAASVKELIAKRVSLISGNVRYVYIGSRPLKDFRYVPLLEGGEIGMNEAEEAVRIL